MAGKKRIQVLRERSYFFWGGGRGGEDSFYIIVLNLPDTSQSKKKKGKNSICKCVQPIMWLAIIYRLHFRNVREG